MSGTTKQDKRSLRADDGLSPAAAATAMRALVRDLDGHLLHQAADELMCRLMREAGYGEAVDEFLEAVGDYHAGQA
jgi:hypothetical protein